MPDKEELEQLLEVGEMEKHLDACEISRLHQMDEAAKIMDAHDKEAAHGNEDPAARLV